MHLVELHEGDYGRVNVSYVVGRLLGVHGRCHIVGSDQCAGLCRSHGDGQENVRIEDGRCDVVKVSVCASGSRGRVVQVSVSAGGSRGRVVQVSVSAGGSRGHAVLVSVSADGGRGHVVRSNAIYQIARTRVDEYRSVSKMKMKDEREPVVVQES